MPRADYDVLAEALAPSGLVLRGGFAARPSDALAGVAAVVLVGHVGRGLWPAFQADRPTGPDPLDNWVRDRLSALAKRFDATLVMPNDGPPYRPFQRWARRAAGLHRSPLGLLIDPEFGLWHALRAALLFTRPIALPPRPDTVSPCAGCADRPCLSACPVNAFTEAGYDAARSRAHVASPAGSACREGGCLARRACPVGAGHRYDPPQQAFHMASFLGSAH